MRFASFDIVFQEVPDEVTLALNITSCPFRCQGCHSPHLREDIGDTLDEQALESLLAQYGNAVTCVAFMGGDADVAEVSRLARFVHGKGCKTAWYSGRSEMPEECSLTDFDYIKVGPYIESLGGLKSKTTNQRFYRVSADGSLADITARFYGG